MYAEIQKVLGEIFVRESRKGLGKNFRKNDACCDGRRKNANKTKLKLLKKKKSQTGCLDIPAFATHVTLDRLLTSCKFWMLLIASVQLCSHTSFVSWKACKISYTGLRNLTLLNKKTPWISGENLGQNLG